MGAVGNTTISAKVSVDASGLDQAQSKLEKLIQVAERAEKPIKFNVGNSAGLAKIEEQLGSIREKMSAMGKGVGAGSFTELNNATNSFRNKLREATETAKQFEGALKSTKEGKLAWDAQRKAVNEYENAIKKANSALKSQEQLQQAQTRTSITAQREQQAMQRTSINEERLQQAQMRTANMSVTPVSGGHRANEGEDWRWRNKVKGSVAETAGMYSLGFMGANAIISAGEKVKEMFGSGYEYTKEQSGMRGTWSTLVDGARGEGISAKAAGSMGNIVEAINKQSIAYGRGLDLTNEAYQQMYHATENAGQTKHMVQSELRIADAMGMSDDDARHFITYGVGHALDRGKVTGGALNQMAQYAPAITGALTRALISSKTGQKMSDISDHDVEKEKTNLRDEIKKGRVNAKMLSEAVNYLGDVKFKDAAENAMHTLPGMTRAVENGIPRMMGSFETSFAKPLEKMMGGSFYKTAKWFTDGQAEKAAAKFGSSLSSLAGDLLKAGQAVAPLAKALGSGFGKGFGDVFKTIKSGVDSISKAGDGIEKNFGKGSPINDLFKQFGKLAGAATAITGLGLIMRHIPVIGGVVNSLFSKLPIIGKLFATNSTAGSKMMSAANTMMAAANRMNGGSGAGGAGGLTGGKVIAGEKLTMGQLLANSKFGRAIDKMFLAGAGMADKKGLRGLIGKMLMGGSSLLGRGGLKGAGIFGRVAESGFGRLIGGTGKFLGRGMPGLNALFAGFDVFSALRNNKAGTEGRHTAVGSAVGGGIGGTLGGALGSFLGPLGTIAGGTIGSWAGSKAGGFVGKNWDGITDTFDKVRKSVTDLGKTLQNVPGFSGFGHVLDSLMHPIENFKRVWSDIKNPKQMFGDLTGQFNSLLHPIEGVNKAVHGIGKALSDVGIKNPLKNFDFDKMLGKIGKWLTTPIKLPKWLTDPIKLPGWMTKPIKMPDWLTKPFKSLNLPKWLTDPIKLPSWMTKPIKLPDWLTKPIKLPGWMTKPFKDFKLPDWLTKPIKLPKIPNPFKDFKIPKWITDFKFPKIPNPFKDWKLPKFKLPKFENPFKDWKLPKFKLPKFTNPFKDWKLPKITNPFKGWKMPKIEWPKPPKWLQNIIDWFTGGSSSGKSSKGGGKSSKGGGSTKKAPESMWSKITSGTGKAFEKIKKAVSSMSTKDIFNGISKMATTAMNSVKKKVSSSVKGISKTISNSFKNLGKGNTFSGLTKGISSAFGKAKTSASKGVNNIVKSVKSGMSKLGAASKSGVSKFSNSIKTGMNKASNAGKTGVNKLVRSVKSGMTKLGSAGKSGINKLSSSVKSGMNKASNAAKTGTNKMVRAVKAGMNKLCSSSKSALNKFSSSIRSGMNKAASSAKSGSNKIVSAIKNSMNKVGSSARSGMSKLSSSIRSGMSRATSAAKYGANRIVSSIKNGMSKIGYAGRSGISKLASSISSGMNRAASSARSGASRIASSIRSGMSRIGSISTSSMNRLVSSITSGMNRAASATRSAMSRLSSAAKSGMSQAVSAMTSGANRMSSAVKSGMSRATSAMQSSFSRMVSSAQSSTSRIASSFSKIGSSANSAASKVNSLQNAINRLHSKTIDIKVNMTGKGADKFAKGTEGTKGGPAWVNDGLGANFQEAFRLPNGKTGLFPKVKNLLVDLPRGTKIWNGDETSRLKQKGKFPHYANGTGEGLALDIPHYANGTGGKSKASVNVTIQNINVGSSATKQDANNIAKAIREAVHEALQREFANAFDLA